MHINVLQIKPFGGNAIEIKSLKPPQKNNIIIYLQSGNIFACTPNGKPWSSYSFNYQLATAFLITLIIRYDLVIFSNLKIF